MFQRLSVPNGSFETRVTTLTRPLLAKLVNPWMVFMTPCVKNLTGILGFYEGILQEENLENKKRTRKKMPFEQSKTSSILNPNPESRIPNPADSGIRRPATLVGGVCFRHCPKPSYYKYYTNLYCYPLKCYYDQKITFIFSSDFETMFVKHSPSEIISVNLEKKTVNLNCNFPV